MLKRTLTVFVFLATFAVIVLTSHRPVGAFFALIGVNIIVGAGLREFYLLSRRKGRVSVPYGIFCGAVLCTLAFLTSPTPLTQSPLPHIAYGIAGFTLLFFFFAWRVFVTGYESALFDFGTLAGGLVYVVFLFSFIVRIDYFSAAGPWWVLSLILIAGGADTFAMLLGKAFGRRKFFPRISPNKTLEGFIGGTLCGVAIAVLCRIIFPLGINLGKGLILGGAVSLISHLGDLSESVLKRDAGVKDSGWLPGVGGVLDMMDSIFFAAPVTYFLMRLWLSE